MNKCRLQGDPASLLRDKATRLTETSADPSHPDHYRWGVASMRDSAGRDLSISETVAAVNGILAAPSRAYDFMIW